MKKLLFFVSIIISAIFLWQCSNDDPFVSTGGSNDDNEWLIPVDQVLDGGPGKDGIPSIDNPQFLPVSESTSVDDLDLVILFKNGDDVYIYPHDILDWHEIVNHFDDNFDISVTYCPLTGTAVGWDPIVDGLRTEFGVSGLLYNSNLMPYDRNSNSTWSQMRLDCVNGEHIRTTINTIPLVETIYRTAKTMYPNAQVLTRNTGFGRNYGTYPYGSYRTNNQLIFPIDETDSSLHLKERVLGIQHNGSTTVFTFETLPVTNESKATSYTIGGDPINIIGSKVHNFLVAFESEFNGNNVVLEGIEITDEAIAKDTAGNFYNIFGEIIQGPDEGLHLAPMLSYIGYWFAWVEFNPNLDLIE